MRGTSRLSRERYILVPGGHAPKTGPVKEIGTADFADKVIDRLPPGSLYLRGGVAGEIVGDAGSRIFRPLGTDEIRLLVDRRVKLGKWHDGAARFTACTRDNGGLVLARAATRPDIPVVQCMTNYPLFLPGFKLCRPGHHNGIFYDEPEKLRGLAPETDSEVIHQVLDDLTVDFPFKDEASRQNYIGELLTPLVRIAIDGNAPAHLHNAPLERTGKTKLAKEGLGGIITGERAPVQQITRNEDEMDKRILAVLMKGQTLMLLDNVASNIDSPSLSSLLTATTYQGRVLGVSVMAELKNNLTVVITGNNVRVSGEIAKRTVPIVLQPASDAPEERTNFKHPDFWGYVIANRRLVLSCLIGLVKGWADAGAKPGTIPMGGFESWAATVGGIMQHFGYHDWMQNAKEWRNIADNTRGDLLALAHEWHRSYGQRQVTAKEVYVIAERLELYPEIVNRGTSERAQQTAFGMMLSKYADRPVGTWIIRRHTASAPTKYLLVPSV